MPPGGIGLFRLAEWWLMTTGGPFLGATPWSHQAGKRQVSCGGIAFVAWCLPGAPQVTSTGCGVAVVGHPAARECDRWPTATAWPPGHGAQIERMAPPSTGI